MKIKKIEYFISKNQVKNQEWLWAFLSKNQNNLKNSIGYWARFLIKTQDCIHAFKCIEPMDPPHTHCSRFKNPNPTCSLKFLISIDLDPLWNFFIKKNLKTRPNYYQKNYISTRYWCELKKTWPPTSLIPSLTKDHTWEDHVKQWWSGEEAEEIWSLVSKSCK